MPGPLGADGACVQAPLTGEGGEGSPQGERGRGEHDRLVREQVLGQHLADLERRDVQRGGPGVVRPVIRPVQPDDFLAFADGLVEGGDHPVGHDRELLEADERGLRGGDLGGIGVVVLRGGDLPHLGRAGHGGVTQRGEGRGEALVELVHPAAGQGGEQRRQRVARLGKPRDLRLVGEPPGPPHGEVDRVGGQLAGGHRGDPVDELVRLVDDHDAVLGQDAALAERVDGEQRVVGDHDVGLGGHPPGPLGEALDTEWAAARPEALARRHRDLPPRLVGHAGDDLVPVPGGGGRGPLVQPLDVRAELAGVRRVEQGVLLVLGPVAQLVEAQVVVAPLEDGELRRAPERPAQRVGQPRQVAVNELALQGDGGRGDDDGTAFVGGQLHGGHQVGQRLARPRACLHGEVRAVGHRVPDGLGHDGLTRPLRSADGTDGGGEERLDG